MAERQRDPLDERKKGQLVGLILGGLLAAAFVAFIFQNTDKVHIEWLAWELSPPLWLAMVVTAASAVVLERIVVFVVRRRRRAG